MRFAMLAGASLIAFSGAALSEPAGCSATPGKPVSRWAIKTSVVNPIDQPNEVVLSYLMDLANPKIDASMRKQMRTGRLARQDQWAVKEGDIIVVEGFLGGAHCSDDDDDYHLELHQTPTAPECFIVEIPNGKYMKAPYKKMADEQRKRVRNLFAGTRPSGELNPPVKVRVMGGLFYDSQHYSKTKPNGGGNRGTNHCASNLWEIHPVLEMVQLP